MHVFLTAHRCAVRPGSGVCGQNAAGVLPADSTSRERLTLSPREEWMVAVEKCTSRIFPQLPSEDRARGVHAKERKYVLWQMRKAHLPQYILLKRAPQA